MSDSIAEWLGRRRWASFAVALLIVLPWSFAVQGQEDEDDELRRTPGLIAVYRAGGRELEPQINELPTIWLSAGQAPDPRLPPNGWSVTWKGVLEIRSPGKYQLAASASGPVKVQIEGQNAIHLQQASKEKVEGQEIELGFGLQPIEIEFQHVEGAPRLQLSWKGETFPYEPLPGYALGHRDAPPQLASGFSHGWMQIEEHSCTACHAASKDLPLSQMLGRRPGPKLTDAGTRLNAAYIYHWLGNPEKIRPGAVMPQLFNEDRQGEIERYAVAQFLASQGKPREPRNISPQQKDQWLKSGQSLFEQTGCLACHGEQGDKPARARLQYLGQKTNFDVLAQYIVNPSVTDPGGRMPGFAFKNDEAYQVAWYLTHRDPETLPELKLPDGPTAGELRSALLGQRVSAQEVLELATKSLDEQAVQLGGRVFRSRRCANCHELKTLGSEDPWPALPAKQDLAAVAVAPRGGCMAQVAGAPGGVPRFGKTFQPEVAAAFLSGLRGQPATPAPGHQARITLQRLNCLGCHERNSAGGLSPDVLALLVANQTEANAEAVSPPALSGVTEKLLGTYLKDVLTAGKRARPWMSLKMPNFAADQVQHLPVGLAALDGAELEQQPYRPQIDPALADAGRTLMGERGFACFKCHDLLNVPSSGTRAPELSLVSERVNFDWFDRWMRDPQRLQPGTRMPTIFPNGKSQYDNVLQGDPVQQRLAVWHYLLASRSLPYPEGLKSKDPAVVQRVDRPGIVRTFLPGVTPRSLAVQFPHMVHLAYDAQACRLAYAWTGEFLDMSPVWTGRGGQRAGIKGQIFWTAPEGFPWDVTSSAAHVPDFTNRGTDTAYGAELPQDGKLHPSKVRFKGYHVSATGPEFRYQLELNDAQTAEFHEQIESLSTDLGPGIVRQARITAARGQLVWLNVATLEEPAAWQTRDGKSGTLEVNGSAPHEAVLRIRQAGATYLLRARNTAPGTSWSVVKQGDQTRLLLRIPVIGDPAAAEVQLRLLRPLNESAPYIDGLMQQELKP